MPRIEEIAAFMQDMAPPELAESWDNVGKLVNAGGDITSILVALDITDEVVNEAEQQGCQLIVSHHPVIFQPLAGLSYKDTVFRMVKKSISAICMHTNLDAAVGGVNDVLAALCGMQSPEPFAVYGRIGPLRSVMTAEQLAAHCATRLNTHVQLADAGKPIRRLAVFSGAGSDMTLEAAAQGADCLVTGEGRHHDAIDAKHAGISLIAAGHFATEFPVVPVVADRLGKRFPSMRVLVSRRNKDPFSYIP